MELFEVEAPVLCEKKELITDSGDGGRQRGGLGQKVVWRNLAETDTLLSLSGGWFHITAAGMSGGELSRLDEIRIDSDPPEQRRCQHLLGNGKGVSFKYPGGGDGNYGSALNRLPEKILNDVRLTYVSPETARDSYRVILFSDGSEIYTAATEALRAKFFQINAVMLLLRLDEVHQKC